MICLLFNLFFFLVSVSNLASRLSYLSDATFIGTVNSMVDQLSAFASEVTRVALEVGTQGILGGQAKVEGVQGTWADLTRNVNVCRFSSFSTGVSDNVKTENGIKLDGSSAFHLGGYQSRGAGRFTQIGGRGCAGRDVGSQGLGSLPSDLPP